MIQISPAYGLYEYQQQVLSEILAELSPATRQFTGPRRCIIAHLPTGAGKTRTACHAACQILNQYQSVGKLVVWLASTEELCQQASDDLTEAWNHLGNRPVNHYELWGNRDLDLNQLKEGILITGLAKLASKAKKDYSAIRQLAERAALVIFDEAHQAIAQTYRFVTEQLISYRAPLLGLTATPGRTADVGDDDQGLAEMFNFKKATIDPRGYPNAVVYLTKEGFLADPQFTPIHIESNVEVKQPQAYRDYSRADLRTIGDNPTWRKAIVETTIKALNDHHRVMVFCSSAGTVKDCVAEIRAAGLEADGVLGTTPHDQRAKIISCYQASEGPPRALLNYGVYTAGFNAPRTRCVVAGRATTSLVLYSQMIGRAMRGPRSRGNRTCQIYTVADSSLPGFRSVAAAFQNWEDLWKTE